MQECPAGKFHFEPPSSFTSFDHLVGAGAQRRRYFEAEDFRRRQVDHQLQFRRKFEWHIARLGAFKDFVDKSGYAAPVRAQIDPISPPSSTFSRFANMVGNRAVIANNAIRLRSL